MEFIATVDLGGTNCRIGIFDIEGNLIKSWKTSSKNFYQPENIISAFSTELNRFDEYKNIKSIGIGAPGLIDNNGVIKTSPNYPLWKDLGLKSSLYSEFGVPVYIENDANLYTLGEGYKGAAIEHENYVAITIGTGIGGGIVINNRIYRGTNGMAGEIGHMTLHPTGPLCGCGKKGCLEAYSSGTAIKKQMFQFTNIEFEPAEIYELAKKGDKQAIKVFEKAGYHLGIGIANIVNILDVSLIVLGGGVSEALDIMITSIKKGFKEHTFDIHFETVDIKKAVLADLAGLYGAFKMVKDTI